jgi:hypothetical protein
MLTPNQNDRTEKVTQLLAKYLDAEDFVALSEISADMERYMAMDSNPTMQSVSLLISDFFRSRGEDEAFIQDWLAQAEHHCRSYGLPDDAIAAAMLADFGLYRYMEFLYMRGMSQEEIMDVFANATEERYELRINGEVIPTKRPPDASQP